MTTYKTDIEIAREASKRPIQEIGAKLNIPSDDLLPFGHDKAKLSAEFIAKQRDKENGKLILVTAINPTPAGEGKTTTTVGLGDGLNAIGKKAAICIREASLGPCFGMKGGAAGGGYAQVVPMDDINLHFTGDFHAITSSAHNLLWRPCSTTMFTGATSRRLTFAASLSGRAWSTSMTARCVRSPSATSAVSPTGLRATAGFDITVASEVMAILCLSSDLDGTRTAPR